MVLGHMWETVATLIEEKGGEIIKNAKVTGLQIINNKVTEVEYVTGNEFKSIPLKVSIFPLRWR